MKTKFITAALLLFTTLSIAQAQTSDIDIKVREQVEAKYKDALILETEHENGNIELDIIHLKRKKSVIFNSKGVWQSTKYDIKKSELPEKIKSVIKNSKYSSYRVDEVEIIETPTKSIYEIGLDKFFSDDITIYITFDGKII